MKRIVVAIDFTEVTSKVLDVAKKMVRQNDGELFLIHADTMEVYIDFANMYTPPPFELYEKQKKVVDEKMKVIHTDLENSGIKHQCTIIEGPTVKIILEQMEKLDADLLIIGSHRHGKLYHFLMGNIHESIITKSQCPVMVIPPLEEDK